METFASEFLANLEERVTKPICEIPLDVWNPRKIAAPERHFANGQTSGIAVDTQIYLLETENAAFDDIESLCRVFFHPVQYQQQSAAALHPIKEQVWLFGYEWLAKYLQLLANPHIMRSDFYRKDHDRFITLLTRMVQFQPKARITFLDALRLWDPTHALVKVPSCDADDASAALVPAPAVSPASAALVPAPAVLPVPVSAALAPADDPSTTAPQPTTETAVRPHPPSRRLILTRHCDLAGRTKTRKNPHN